MLCSSHLANNCVEIEAPIVVLLTVWRPGVPIMGPDGKSRLTVV